MQCCNEQCGIVQCGIVHCGKMQYEVLPGVTMCSVLMLSVAMCIAVVCSVAVCSVAMCCVAMFSFLCSVGSLAMCSDTSVWLPSILPLRWESSNTSCEKHLQLSVSIPSSGVWDYLVEIWGRFEVRLRFLKSPKVEKSLTKINKNRHNFLTNNVILMPLEI